MARDVIMPALGMAQETGLIVAWLKKPGEAVKAGEPLFEVETDKAVMAVEADTDGVLAELRHGEGAEVSVGEVIARIAKAGEAGAVAGAKAAAASPLAGAEAAVPGSPAPAPRAEPMPFSTTTGGAPARIVPGGRQDRVLASPKARRLAGERGIDLRALVRAGLPQPLHAADLDRLPAPRTGSGVRLNHIAARAGARAFLAFRHLLAEEGAPPSDAALWAAFAAGSLRDAGRRGKEALVVTVERPGASAASFRDPDIGALAELREAGDDARPTLILRDLTGSRLTEVALARDGCPSVSVAGGGEGYALVLAFSDESLSEEEAMAFLDALAARIEQPLRHLL